MRACFDWRAKTKWKKERERMTRPGGHSFFPLGPLWTRHCDCVGQSLPACCSRKYTVVERRRVFARQALEGCGRWKPVVTFKRLAHWLQAEIWWGGGLHNKWAGALIRQGGGPVGTFVASANRLDGHWGNRRQTQNLRRHLQRHRIQTADFDHQKVNHNASLASKKSRTRYRMPP